MIRALRRLWRRLFGGRWPTHDDQVVAAAYGMAARKSPVRLLWGRAHDRCVVLDEGVRRLGIPVVLGNGFAVVADGRLTTLDFTPPRSSVAWYDRVEGSPHYITGVGGETLYVHRRDSK